MIEMKIDKALGSAIVAIIVLGSLCGVLAYQNITAIPNEIIKQPQEITATIVINFTNDTVRSFEITTRNATVYGFLLEAAKEENGNFTIKATYWGSYDAWYVWQIGDAVEGTDGKYWQYYVNDELAGVGCDKYIVQNNDYIEWEFEVPTWWPE